MKQDLRRFFLERPALLGGGLASLDKIAGHRTPRAEARGVLFFSGREPDLSGQMYGQNQGEGTRITVVDVAGKVDTKLLAPI